MRNNMWGDRDPGMRHVEEVHRSIGPPGEAWRGDVAPVGAPVRGNQDGIVDLCAVLARRSDRPAPKRRHHLERGSGVDGAELDRSSRKVQAGRVRQSRSKRWCRCRGGRKRRHSAGMRALDSRCLANGSQLDDAIAQRGDQDHHQSSQGEVPEDRRAPEAGHGLRGDASNHAALEIRASRHLVIEALRLIA